MMRYARARACVCVCVRVCRVFAPSELLFIQSLQLAKRIYIWYLRLLFFDYEALKEFVFLKLSLNLFEVEYFKIHTFKFFSRRIKYEGCYF